MRNIFLLGLTSLLADFSSEMVQPLLPFFITALGGTGVAIGLIGGGGDALASIFKVLSGYWADKSKKYKKFVYLGYGFSAIAKFFFPLAKIWQHVLILRPVERIGKGLRDAPRDAIVSESTLTRGRGFGIQRAMDSMGAIIGSITVYILFVNFNFDFRVIFFLAAIIALTALIPLVFVKEPRALKEHRIISKKLTFKGLSPKLKKFMAIAALFHLANFSYMFFVLKASEVFKNVGDMEADGIFRFFATILEPEKLTIGLPILLYIFFNIFDTFLSTPAGILSDKIGRKPVVLIGYVLFAIASLGFIFAGGLLSLLALFAVYGASKAFIDSSQKAFVSDLSPVENRATSLGAFETSTGLALIPAGLIAGVLWNLNPAYTFIYGAGLSAIAVVALFFTIKNSV